VNISHRIYNYVVTTFSSSNIWVGGPAFPTTFILYFLPKSSQVCLVKPGFLDWCLRNASVIVIIQGACWRNLWESAVIDELVFVPSAVQWASRQEVTNYTCLYSDSFSLCHIYRHSVESGKVASIYVSAPFPRRGKYPRVTDVFQLHHSCDPA